MPTDEKDYLQMYTHGTRGLPGPAQMDVALADNATLL